MAWLIGDSFDFYAATADAAAGHWDSVGTSSYVQLETSNTRFSTGRALKGGSLGGSVNPALTKSLGSNEATLFVAVAFCQTTALSGTSQGLTIALRDGATAQCSIVFQSNGDILLKSAVTGTVLATWAGAFQQNVWAHFQFKVTIDNGAGAFTVRKDGAAGDSFSATGLNTRGGTANPYANALALYFVQIATVVTQVIDDLLIYSGHGAAPNDWIGDVRAVQLMASADTAQKDFAPLPTTATEGHTGSTGNANQSASTLYWNGAATSPQTPIIAASSGVVHTTTANLHASMTGHLRMALYAADGTDNGPGTLLSVSDEVTNPAAGLVTFTHASPATITKGEGYWLAFLADATWASKDYVTAFRQSYSAARSYASGFPNPAVPGSLTNLYHWYATMTITVENAMNVDEPAEDGDSSYVYGAGVGDEDLYDLDPLAVTPAAIVAVQSRVFARKSDAGSRSGQVRLKSGATEAGGADTALSTSYAWLTRVDTLDPDTGAAWTPGAVNTLQIGAKVTA